MKTKQPIKRVQQFDISDMATKRHTVSDESCRTNKHVNTISVNNTSHSNISNIEYTSDTVSFDSLVMTNVLHTISTAVVCDGLNFTAHLNGSDQPGFQYRLKKYSGPLKITNAQKMKPYRQGRNIYVGDQVVAQIRFDPFDDSAGYFFLHVNPAKLDVGQSQLIQDLVSYLLDEPWCSFVGRAKVSMFDAAVDAHGVNISSIIPVPANAIQSGYFLKFFKEGGTRLYKQGTEYVGHNRSEKHACVYNKVDEQADLIGVTGDEEVTRIEIQVKPRFRAKFGDEICTLADLPRYTNPFRMLDVAEFPKGAKQDDLLKIATVLTAYVGATAVLRLVGDKGNRSRLKEHLSTPPCSWWQPEKHWVAFLLGLAQHPLFVCCDLLSQPEYSQILAFGMSSIPHQS